MGRFIADCFAVSSLPAVGIAPVETFGCGSPGDSSWGDGVWLEAPSEPVAAALPGLAREVGTAVDDSIGGAGFAVSIAATRPVPREADGADGAVTPIFGMGRVGGSPALTSTGAVETARAPFPSPSCVDWL